LRNSSEQDYPPLPARACHLKQIHSASVVSADTITATMPEADAAFAKLPGSVCVVRTADCVPVLLCDKQGTQVAAIHAGWRGMAAGIIQTTAKKLGIAPQECLTWIGPCIGPSAFEVGRDVLEGFRGQGWSEAIISQAFKPRLGVPQKWLGNLVLLAKHALQEYGVPVENLYGGDWCTYSDPARFYSYRRSQHEGDSQDGRMSTFIWLQHT
jgi:YfiH family protein